MDTSTSFTVTTQQHDNEEDLFIEIPQEILEYLGWKEGDELNWHINHKEVILTKIENTTTIKKQHIQTNNDWYTVKEEAIKEYIQDNQSDEQSKDRTVPTPSNFPHFP